MSATSRGAGDQHDGDESLFASYDEVQFRARQGGDVVEATATVVASAAAASVAFAARVVCRARQDIARRQAEVLDEITGLKTATGTWSSGAERVLHGQTEKVIENKRANAPSG